MSGGSYDYLCYRDAEEILTHLSTLQDMADDLAKLGYAPDAASETQHLLLEIRAAQNRIQARIDRLSPVWKALEWWRSGDTGEDYLKARLVEYRGD